MTGLPIGSVGNDYAENPGLSVEQLAGFMRDIDWQPRWRVKADIDSDYYDSNQLDSKVLQLMEERGIPPIVINMIKPSIDLILGMEEKTRRDWVVRADDDKDVEFAAAMSKELQWAERGARADVACSLAYAQQVKAGLGWVHTRKERLNPFRFPYVCEHVHRREIWWDWHDDSDLLKNARWLVRRKWYDYDVVAAMWPQHKKLISQIASGWDQFEYAAQMDVAHPLYQDWIDSRDFYYDIDEWRNPDRKRVGLYEVWYRKWSRGYVLKARNGMVTTLDEKNPQHLRLVEAGLGEVVAATIPEVRLSYWIGPHRLSDIASPLPHEDFPYVPFWGYREDRTGIPYGHIRQMRPLQDEINARRARMLWQLSARRMIGWDDAVKDKKAVELEIARPDSAVWLNAAVRGNRSITDMLQVDDNQGLNAQQFSAYQDAKTTIQDVANVFKEQLGKSGQADSGIAISQLIEQGTMSLAGVNSRYRTAREAVGQQLYALRAADIGNEEREVTIERAMGQKKVVKLNEKKFDKELGIGYRSNSVALTKAKVVLDHVESSSTFRQFQFKELVQLAKGLPSPELQAAVLDMVISASDAPYKDELAQRVRDALGIQNHDVEAMTPEEQDAYQEKMRDQEIMKQLREEMQLLTKEKADLENRLLDAETEKTEAETDKIRAETGKVEAEEDKTKAEAKQTEMGSSDRVPGADPARVPMRDIA